MASYMMSGKVHRGELWVRCPFCGDSRSNFRKAHLSVELKTGLYYCFRCTTSGRFPPRSMFDLLAEAGVASNLFFDDIFDSTEFDIRDEVHRFQPGPGSNRRSLAIRYNSSDPEYGYLDIFELRGPASNVVGILVRGKNKYSRIRGTRGVVYPRSAVGTGIYSSPNDPIRLVEGPYDMLDNRTFALAGLFSAKHILKHFSYQFIVLCPDGDVWEKPRLFRTFAKNVMALERDNDIHVCHIEYIPDGLDPDECPPHKRKIITMDEFQRGVKHLDIT